MSTSGDGLLNALAYLAVIVAALAATRATVGDIGARVRPPHPVVVALWLTVAVPSVVGLIDDGVYDALSRQPHAIRYDGQLWRLLTGAVVQDGGVVGTAFNLVVLALVATSAVLVWGPRLTPAILVVGALGFNALATYAFQSPGAGNSGATFFLATTVVGGLVARRRARQTLVAGAVVTAAGIGLVAGDDAHGVPVLAGLLAGAATTAALTRARRHSTQES